MGSRLNWQKIVNSPTNKQIEQRGVDQVEKAQDCAFLIKKQKQLLSKGIWPSGKHSGKHIQALDKKYLIWAGINLKSRHMKQAANAELIRRYHSGEIKI
jgi:hypothetical protein